MSMVNYQTREILSRVLYLGSEGAGKATNLDYIYGRTGSGPSPGRAQWEMDGLQLTLGEISGFTTRLHLWPVVGAPFYGSSRKLVMGTPERNSIDAIVWVVDSQRERLEAGEVMAEMFREELVACGYDLAKLVVVMQYNKRDLASSVPIAELDAKLNPDKRPIYEAVATKGVGVFDTLKHVSKQILLGLRRGQ